MYGKILIRCDLEVRTGMHIGGSSAFSAIGAVDSPVVRDPYTGYPIVPGSSLKGKLRTLLARSTYQDIEAMAKAGSCDKDPEQILRLFGSSEPVRRSRLQFADAFLSNAKELSNVGVTEVKSENTINRLTSKANPRQIERIVAGARFGINIVYNLSDPKEMEEDLSLLSKAMKLLQLDYLGGHGAPLQMEPLGSHSVENGLQLLLAAREEPASRTRLWFRTPCAFKQAGRYAIYPQEFLLLQSLVLHWNTAFPDCQLSDPDALDAILRGLRILDYNLHTVSYPIKNTRIPGFVGSAVVEARLALPLLELWNALLSFAPYGGIGIKTTLGMGGVSVEPLAPPQRSL